MFLITNIPVFVQAVCKSCSVRMRMCSVPITVKVHPIPNNMCLLIADDMYNYNTATHVQLQYSYKCTTTIQLHMYNYNTAIHVQLQYS